jgi:alanyl-tRNA synthetase
MTERLYYTDAYRARFESDVVRSSNDGLQVVLTQTAFYPTSGGQPHDQGTLGGAVVIDVRDDGDEVVHILDRPLTTSTVHGAIDWVRRFDHMQQHTGQHLVSAVFADLFACETLSVHFGPDYATVDLSAAQLTTDQLRDAELRANELVWENRAVHVTFEDAASARGLRKPSEREGTLRVVTIDALDRSACGGTHVHRTGEIGAIQLRRQERVNGRARIEFLCGGRTVRRTRADYNILAALAADASASIDELSTLIPAQRVQLREAEQRWRKLDEELAGVRARAAWEQAPADGGGVRWFVEWRAAGTPDDVRPFALAFAGQPKAVYAAAFPAASAVLLAASPDAGVDAGKRLKDVLAAVGGRGGGSPRLAQGSVPGLAALRHVATTLGIPE